MLYLFANRVDVLLAFFYGLFTNFMDRLGQVWLECCSRKIKLFKNVRARDHPVLQLDQVANYKNKVLYK